MDTFKLVRSEELIESGQSLLDGFGTKRDRFPIALWMKKNDEEKWMLVLASKDYRERGPLNLYKYLDDTIKANNIPLTISDISLIDSKSSLAKDLRVYKEGAGAWYKGYNGLLLIGDSLYPVLKIYHIH